MGSGRSWRVPLARAVAGALAGAFRAPCSLNPVEQLILAVSELGAGAVAAAAVVVVFVRSQDTLAGAQPLRACDCCLRALARVCLCRSYSLASSHLLRPAWFSAPGKDSKTLGMKLRRCDARKIAQTNSMAKSSDPAAPCTGRPVTNTLDVMSRGGRLRTASRFPAHGALHNRPGTMARSCRTFPSEVFAIFITHLWIRCSLDSVTP